MTYLGSRLVGHQGASGGATGRDRKTGGGFAKVLRTCLDTVNAGGNVLLPTDSSGRVLELLAQLDAGWQSDVPLVFVSHVGSSTVRDAHLPKLMTHDTSQ